MDEKPDQILGHIEAQRSELGRNLNELETRVRRGTDWKTYFDRNPMMMLGVALGGGLLLGTAVGNKRKHQGSRGRTYSSGVSSSALGFASAGTMSSGSSSRSGSPSRTASPMMAEQRQQLSETMEHVKAALIGFGIAKAKEFMCQAIPGFDQHLSEAEQKRGSQRSQPSGFSSESSGTQSGSWDSDEYGSGGLDNSGTYGNMRSGSTGQTGYRGSQEAGEPVGAGTTSNVTP
jgi:hypothetical protein